MPGIRCIGRIRINEQMREQRKKKKALKAKYTPVTQLTGVRTTIKVGDPGEVLIFVCVSDSAVPG